MRFTVAVGGGRSPLSFGHISNKRMSTPSSKETETKQPQMPVRMGGKAVFELADAPKHIAAIYRLFGYYGTIAIVAGPLFFGYFKGETSNKIAPIVCLGIAVWGVLSLVAAFGLKRRRSWSRVVSCFSVIAVWIFAVIAFWVSPIWGPLVVGFWALTLSIHLFSDEWTDWLAS